MGSGTGVKGEAGEGHPGLCHDTEAPGVPVPAATGTIAFSPWNFS